MAKPIRVLIADDNAVSGQNKWTEIARINGTEEEKEARGGPLEKKQGQVS